jgi:NADH-quinone oxidoreductase subunit J
MLDAIFFYFFSLCVLAGAVLTITRRSVVVSGVWLVVSLLGVAGLFLLQGAEFLFISQLILYIGGVVLLFLVAMMLVNWQQARQLNRFRSGWPVMLCAGAALAAELIVLLTRGAVNIQATRGDAQTAAGQVGDTAALSDALLSKYLLPFEVASVLLLAAIVGAVFMGQKREDAA